ncbi:MAG TPA: hypothetical protein VFS40_00245 [Gemmatimonadales bacterium]|nr:hypothetical protein [Gemmatimonadales bacterium]
MRERMPALLSVAVLLLLAGCGSDPAQPDTAALRVVATTGGADLDPDGYLVVVDGGAAQPLGVNDSLDVGDLAAGNHAVGFGGLAPNCTLAGNPVRGITLEKGDAARIAFAVTCTALPPGATGAIAVTTATTGSAPDPDGYTVTLDAGTPQPIGAAATVTLADVATGPHFVTLGGLAANCHVEGDNPLTVTVAAAATVNAGFAVFCPGT